MSYEGRKNEFGALTSLQLFLRFRGPTTILLQSRAGGITDVLTSRDVNEIADSPAGAVSAVLHAKSAAEASAEVVKQPPRQYVTTTNYATVGKEGIVTFDDVKAKS